MSLKKFKMPRLIDKQEAEPVKVEKKVEKKSKRSRKVTTKKKNGKS